MTSIKNQAIATPDLYPMTNQELINDLRQRTEWNLNASRNFLSLTDEQLNRREVADRWSVLECLEHLIRYSNFYIPEIGKTIADAPKSFATLAHTESTPSIDTSGSKDMKSKKLFSDHQPRFEASDVSKLKFKSGFIGNKMALSMRPGEEGTKMKTFKNMNPIGSKLDRRIIDTFIRQQQETLVLLERCRTVNLSKLKTGITLTKFIRLRLGDTLRVVIYHNQRHIEQAERVVENTK